MKLSIDARRLIQRSLSNLPSSLNTDEFLTEIELTADIKPKDRFRYLDEKYKYNWSITIFRKIWRKVELIKFLNTPCSIYQAEKMKINFKSTRRKMKKFIFDNDKLVSIEIYSNPQIIMIGMAHEKKYSSLQDKMMIPDDMLDMIYWLPKEGLILSNNHKDELGEQFMNNIQEHITGELKEIRLRSMDLTKFYRQTKKITKVRISSNSQITGFYGMEHIEFMGEDIKKGAYGLQQRQEIDIRGLDSIGPNIEIASDDIHLYIGSKVTITSIKGIDELQKLIREKGE